jgi:hypothetical protein
MEERLRWPAESWLLLLAGLAWLWWAPAHGLPGLLLALLPGCLLLGSGVAMLLMPGDHRIAQLAGLGGAVGMLLALPAGLVAGLDAAALLLAASLVGFTTAGWHSLRIEPDTPEVPPARRDLWTAAQVAVDEALLSTLLVTAPLPLRGEHAAIQREVAAARELFEASGWLEKPADYHLAPPPLEEVSIRETRLIGRIHYEHLRFESGYEPHPGEPGRERWLSYARNRTGHAWLLRDSRPRPWLVCIHGYQMGWPLIDFGAFPPPWLHERLGLNLLIPTLPLHGRRKFGLRSGDGFVSGQVLDTTHALAQAMWDIRRLLGWLRAQGEDVAVGALGYSLGGYCTALLACLDDGLACAIAGIPATDFTRAYYRHGPLLHLRAAAESGIEERSMRDVLSVVSPLALEPRVPFERRYVFAGVADRIVPPDQPRDLWRHWGRPRIEWYQGSHVTFRAHPAVVRLMSSALRESGLAS